MNDYTPTTDEVRQSFATNPPGDRWHPRRDVHREAFDRWLAEVERAAAEKALTDAADEVDARWGDTGLGAVGASWLRARAATLGLNEGENDD